MAQTSNRLTGSVKWFNGIKGFGFITPDDGGEDCFVHQSSIRSDGFRTLAEGQLVEFLISEDENGRVKAVDVTGPDGSSIQGASNGSDRRNGFGGGRGGGGGYGDGEYGFNGGRSRGGGGYGDGEYGFNGGRSRGGGGYGGGGGGGGGACYNCGETGHIARDCYQGGGGGGGRGGACYNCGETGHLARDCSGSSGGGGGRYAGGGGGGDRSCYNCGDMGHFARDCPGKN